MKKKIALLLAAAMTLSLLPMNVFAASTNSLSKNVSVMPENTLMAETGTTLEGGGVISSGSNYAWEYEDVDYVTEAPYLKIELKDTLAAGSEIKLTLENAKWFFRTQGNESDYDAGKRPLGGPVRTWNNAFGSYSSGTKTYEVTSPAALGGPNQKVSYSLVVSETNNKVATITMKDKGVAEDVIWVPIVALTTAANDVKVRVDSNTSISSGLYMIGSASGTLTSTTVTDPQSGRDEFELKDFLVVRENRIGSIKNGWFEVKAPTGFEFAQNLTSKDSDGDQVVQIGLESGLTWNNNSIYKGKSSYGEKDVDYAVRFKYDGYDYDYSVLEVGLFNTEPSSTVSGAVYIKGLKLYADESASMGAINLTIRNINRKNSDWRIATWIDVPQKYDGDKSGGDVLTTQSNVLAGTRVDWAMTFKTITDVPTLVSGRYESENPYSASDDYHQTAKVEFSENAVNSWWANRYTNFVLPEQVKFRKVDITDDDEIPDDLLTGYNDGIYYNTGKKQGSVTIDGNVMTWQNLTINADKKAVIKFDIWVSIESGFEGDVTLAAEAALSTASGRITTDEDIPAIVIAKAVNPITIDTKVTDVKVGYQYQATADITITETAAGRLLKNKEVRVSVSDMVSSDMILSAGKAGEVTAGDIKISNWSHTSGGYATRASGSSLYGSSGKEGSAITFKISQQSSKASTIKISNLSVKLDRGVPETNHEYYKAVVWGTAIAENFGERTASINGTKTNVYDTFDIPGIMADYIKVVSSADNSALLNNEIRVKIGESYYTVNGMTYDMDAAAYISPATNSTMVPIRFMAYALGLDENKVVWDDTNRTVTLIHPAKVVQFTIGSSTMLVNGVPMGMVNVQGGAVAAEIKNSRSYIPFRAFGDAFGVPVDWDASTQEAIYNKGAVTTLQ